MPVEKHIGIYLRVSSKHQDTRSQEPDLRRWADANDDQPIVWYRDKFTGKSMDRPGWNKLQAAIERGEVSRVVCWRLDRLGRTAKGLTALFATLTERKVNLVSLKDGLDLGTAAGRLMANVLASVAQFETELRAERVQAGQAAAKAAGKTWGGSKKGRLISVTHEQIRVVHDMKGRDEAVTSIARATGLSRPTIYRVLEQHSPS